LRILLSFSALCGNVGFERLRGGGRSGGRRAGRGRACRGGGRRSSAFEVGLDDAAAGSAAGQRSEIDALVSGDALGERARLDPLALRGRGRGGGRRRSGCSRGCSRVSRRGVGLGGRRRCRCRRRRNLGAARILVLAGDNGDHGADLHIVGAFGDQDLCDRAFIDRFEFHRRLVGFDFGQKVT